MASPDVSAVVSKFISDKMFYFCIELFTINENVSRHVVVSITIRKFKIDPRNKSNFLRDLKIPMP